MSEEPFDEYTYADPYDRIPFGDAIRFEEEQVARDRDAERELEGEDEGAWYDGLQLAIRVPEGEPYILGPLCELADAIDNEARVIAEDAGSDLLEDPGEAARAELRAAIITEATVALNKEGATYRDPNRVLWVLEKVPSEVPF